MSQIHSFGRYQKGQRFIGRYQKRTDSWIDIKKVGFIDRYKKRLDSWIDIKKKRSDSWIDIKKRSDLL